MWYIVLKGLCANHLNIIFSILCRAATAIISIIVLINRLVNEMSKYCVKPKGTSSNVLFSLTVTKSKCNTACYDTVYSSQSVFKWLSA